METIIQRISHNSFNHNKIDALENLDVVNLLNIFDSWNNNKTQLIGEKVFGYARSIGINNYYCKKQNCIFYSINEDNRVVLQFMYKDAKILTKDEQEHLQLEMQKSGILHIRIEEAYKALQETKTNISRSQLFDLFHRSHSYYNLEVLPKNIVNLNHTPPINIDQFMRIFNNQINLDYESHIIFDQSKHKLFLNYINLI